MTDAQIQNSILKTLAYRDVFSYPLTTFETYIYLIASEKVEPEKFYKNLHSLIESGRIKKYEDFVHLGLSNPLRESRNNSSRELMKKAERTCRLLSLLPTIKFMAVTGAVAAGNSPLDDDIDLLIVTSKNSIWISRFFVVIVLKILNWYRTDGNESGKICPNIWLDERDLFWNQAQNVYVAHEILLMKPVVDRGDYYFKFVGQNRWVFDFFPHISVNGPQTASSTFSASSFLEDVLERLFMKSQLLYMKRKQTKEITTDKMIHFKRDDNSTWILEKFEEKCRRMGIQF